MYETVEESDDDAHGEPPVIGESPIWKRKPLLILATAVLVLGCVVGLTFAGIAIFDNKTQKIAADDDNDNTPSTKSKKTYEYVPPANAGKQRIDEDEGSEEKDTANTVGAKKEPNKRRKRPQETQKERPKIAMPNIVPRTKIERPDLKNALSKPIVSSCSLCMVARWSSVARCSRHELIDRL